MVISESIYRTIYQALIALDNAYGNEDEIDAARDWLSSFDIREGI